MRILDEVYSSFPIKLESIFRAMGRDEEQVKALSELNQEQRYLDQVKATLR